MKRLQTIFVRLSAIMLLVVAMTASASALDLDAARAKGLAGEVDNGLLAVPPGASNEAEPVIAAINNQRRAEYAKIAAQNNLGLQVVGTMMFQKIYPRLPAGTWVQIQGTWKQKAP
ncbi:DUF1318 domain-containing protein [Chlorobium phaeovibrioides]|uniref:DUF1318 domain-containing protein n=2 Tax=Chlorobium phaeovibrioides TaxID=1094 RepID=A0A432AX91_CHLPH|nr:YdbL family protein [Chlorobium phaeovibrioides]KAA6232472.1 DUF1318 domain-containing protein [Chlorobium phaeovibrioides]RTY35020.1 DUF1318 domain-containing protein [Chlorobium phaeovibrioides]RTY40027.1 DUF1318 domain-containing protein [Chlorobium phaeovibrioides]